MRLSDHGRIAWPITHEGGFWYDTCPDKSVLHTTRIPLAAFEAANPALDLDRLNGVGIRADITASGHLFLDDVEFTQ